MHNLGKIVNKNAIHTPFGDMIHAWRVENRFSYPKASQVLGVATNTLVAYEIRGQEPSKKLRQKIEAVITGRSDRMKAMVNRKDCLFEIYSILGKITEQERYLEEQIANRNISEEEQKLYMLSISVHEKYVIDIQLFPAVKTLMTLIDNEGESDG